MKFSAVPLCLAVLSLGVFLPACSSTPRAQRKPAVAIVISAAPGTRPDPAEIAEIHRTLQPELERRGYVMARSSRSADYFAQVRLPFDASSPGNFLLERAEPTVPFIRSHETESERRQREYKSAIAEMVREPK